MYLGAYSGIFCFFLSYFNKSKFPNWLAAPFIWVSLEYIRAHLLTGFPWASLAYSQSQFISVIQIVDITGIYGLSFLIVFINVSLFLLLNHFYSFQAEKIKPAILRINIITAIFLFLATIGYGHWKIFYHKNHTGKKPLKVALLQGNIDQNHKWDMNYQQKVYETYQEMTLDSAKENPGLIVWPEAATPFYFSSNEVYQKKLLRLGKESKSFILFGSPRYTRTDKNTTSFNSAFLISPEKKVLGQYDKMHLVPFGEYVPFKNLLFFVDKMVTGIGDFGSGTEFSVFSLPEWQFSVLICFEVIFPDQVRRFVKTGAEFLVNITNDAWFGKSAASYQHISMVIFRAIENRRPVIRAANTGITGIINNRGEVIAQADIFIRDKIAGEIFPEKNYQTVYTRYGDIFAILVILCTMAYGIFILSLTYKKK